MRFPGKTFLLSSLLALGACGGGGHHGPAAEPPPDTADRLVVNTLLDTETRQPAS